MAIYKTRWFDRWAKKQGVGRAGEERRFPHAGGDEQGQPMDFRVCVATQNDVGPDAQSRGLSDEN
jgi:hypothetical protein